MFHQKYISSEIGGGYSELVNYQSFFQTSISPPNYIVFQKKIQG